MSTLRLRPEQVAAMLVFEAQIHALNIATSQVGGFLKMAPEADALARVRDVLISELERVRAKWAGQVVVVQASEMPKAVVSP
jgi:hypothetical protein